MISWCLRYGSIGVSCTVLTVYQQCNGEKQEVREKEKS